MPSNQSTLSIHYVCFKTEESAKKMSKLLLKEKLIACANIFPKIKSIYIWDGSLNENNEIIALFKGPKVHSQKIKQLIEKNHEYECPCILEFTPHEANSKYLEWVNESTTI